MRDIDKEAQVEKRDRLVGEWLRAVEFGRGVGGLQDGTLTSVRIKMPRGDDPSALLILKGSDEDGDHVAFIGGTSIYTLMLKWRAQDGTGAVRWREDIPWSQRR